MKTIVCAYCPKCHSVEEAEILKTQTIEKRTKYYLKCKKCSNQYPLFYSGD